MTERIAHGDPMEISPWIGRLRAAPILRDQAIAELRAYLVRGLRKSLPRSYGGRVDVEDIAQVAILRILDSLDSFAGRSRFETWCMTIAIRVGISELRRKYYKTISLGALSMEDGLEFEIPDTRDDRELDSSDTIHSLEQLRQLIDSSLTEKQQLAIRGVLAGLPIEVIAERLGSNRNAIYKLVHDARVKLKQGLEQRGITMPPLPTSPHKER